MTGAPQVVLDATVELLRRHAPFDRMDRESLLFLAGRLKLAYFAKGRRVAAPEHGIATALYVVQRGLVCSSEADGDTPGANTVEYSSGECFPLAAVIGRRPARHVYTAVKDSFCYEADVDTIEELARRSPSFQAFCNSRVSTLLQQSYAQLQAFYAEQSAGRQPMNAFLRELVRGMPLVCPPGESLRNALQGMWKVNVGSIVVVDGSGSPVGIFTERDLFRHTVAGGLDLERAIENYMTPAPKSLPASASAAEAAVLMAEMGIRHVLVEEGGRLLGVVSERALFALQRTSIRDIIHSIRAAADLPDLVRVATDIRAMAHNMIAQGMGAEHLARIIATLNDKLGCRVLELEALKHDLGELNFCWIALGSEGRLEQTLATDQDNGIIFTANGPPEQIRERLLPFAQAVNQALDQCGFPLCKGGIMAGNPQWCLSLDEWQARFGEWIRNPLPQALLHSSIFYDFRALWGDEDLANRLRAWLNAKVKGDQRFLRAMAQNALESRPPLGFFTGFVTSGGDGEPDTIDLKAQGARLFVDAARIYALAGGQDQTNTAMRLRLAGEAVRIPRAEMDAIVDAYHFILLLRLRHQHARPQNDVHANRIAPDGLNDLDRRILKEAFLQARKLQSRLSLDYQL